MVFRTSGVPAFSDDAAPSSQSALDDIRSQEMLSMMLDTMREHSVKTATPLWDCGTVLRCGVVRQQRSG